MINIDEKSGVRKSFRAFFYREQGEKCGSGRGLFADFFPMVEKLEADFAVF